MMVITPNNVCYCCRLRESCRVLIVHAFSQCLIVFTDKIEEGEFIQGVLENKDILRLIQFDEPKKIQEKLKEKKH